MKITFSTLLPCPCGRWPCMSGSLSTSWGCMSSLKVTRQQSRTAPALAKLQSSEFFWWGHEASGDLFCFYGKSSHVCISWHVEQCWRASPASLYAKTLCFAVKLCWALRCKGPEIQEQLYLFSSCLFLSVFQGIWRYYGDKAAVWLKQGHHKE